MVNERGYRSWECPKCGLKVRHPRPILGESHPCTKKSSRHVDLVPVVPEETG